MQLIAGLGLDQVLDEVRRLRGQSSPLSAAASAATLAEAALGVSPTLLGPFVVPRENCPAARRRCVVPARRTKRPFSLR